MRDPRDLAGHQQHNARDRYQQSKQIVAEAARSWLAEKQAGFQEIGDLEEKRLAKEDRQKDRRDPAKHFRVHE
ncbi:MAG: hypothetical protein ACFB21_06920 [Opitutales bacterium]